MEELAQEARSFDSKPKALSKGLGLGGGGSCTGGEEKSTEEYYLSTVPDITKF